jgi:acyl-CoA thioesterase-1
MKKIMMIGAAVLSAAMLLTACGEAAQDISSDTAAVTETEASKAPETPEEFQAAMISRSLYSLGNPSRLKAKLKQAQAGEEMTVAYIGGSITRGETAGAEGCYAKLSYNYIAEKYGTCDNVKYVNAGVSGTPSVLGNLRLQKDVLDYNADIVFVEFAVNDAQDNTHKESYESLVRTVLTQENAPAVILLFNRTANGYTAQEYMKEIGEYYSLPMISAADALTPEFDEGRMTWDDYSDDQSHPNDEGHKLICSFIENLLTEAENAPDEEYTLPPAYRFGYPFMDSQLVTPTDPEAELISLTDTGSFEAVEQGATDFPTSWKLSDGGTEPLKFKATASSVFLLFKRNNSDTMGSFDVYINGAKVKTIHSNQKDGWNEPYSELAIKFQTIKDMDIEIRPAEGSDDKNITILGVAVAAQESTQ